MSPTAHHRWDRGATAVEYALLIALIALPCISGLQMIESRLGAAYTQQAAAISGDHNVGASSTPPAALTAAPAATTTTSTTTSVAPTTTIPASTTTVAPTTTTTTPPTLQGSCTASSDRCTLSVTNAAPGRMYSWSLTTTGGDAPVSWSPNGSTAFLTGGKSGNYTIKVTSSPGGPSNTILIKCTGASVCTAT